MTFSLLDIDVPIADPAFWTYEGGVRRRVLQVGQTFALRLRNGQVSPSLSIARAPAGSALTVSSLALSGPFVAIGRYQLQLTNAAITRLLDIVVVPASLPVAPNVIQSMINDRWDALTDATLDGLTSDARRSSPNGIPERRFARRSHVQGAGYRTATHPNRSSARPDRAPSAPRSARA